MKKSCQGKNPTVVVARSGFEVAAVLGSLEAGGGAVCGPVYHRCRLPASTLRAVVRETMAVAVAA